MTPLPQLPHIPIIQTIAEEDIYEDIKGKM